ncbi:serine/threonine-protein kinase [Actinomycetospora termitidis]|uniref:non-specific serine/threonine protein kinase n=1 Tax=Actinomycetospora termitidis TaxID=3053470 RepID=A0ABT7MD42_9PSEU|nr:protein kinase [Actinomycetospora sp. Odt1-22]MDL5158084.1 protein kinase [Actinomycetospora sp. Odt1-22]
MTDQPWVPGQEIGRRYRLEECVGQGGNGQVWRAHDPRRAAAVALKVLVAHPDATPDELRRDRERFLHEARETSRLEGGPHIISIYDWDQHGDRPYLVMPYDDGQNLARIVAGGPLDPPRAVHLLGQVAEALDYAHARGRVHRDVKPSNVLVRRVGAQEYVRVVDFGIVGLSGAGPQGRMTRTGTVIGSLAYMAPERFPSGPDLMVHVTPDERFDVYGLACLLFECLTGERAFVGNSELEFVRAHRSPLRPRPSDVSADTTLEVFDDVVAAGLALDRATRTATAAGFKAEMEAALERWRSVTVHPTVRTSGGAPSVAEVRTTPVNGRPATARTTPMTPAPTDAAPTAPPHRVPVDGGTDSGARDDGPVDAPSVEVPSVGRFVDGEPVDAPSSSTVAPSPVEPVEPPVERSVEQAPVEQAPSDPDPGEPEPELPERPAPAVGNEPAVAASAVPEDPGPSQSDERPGPAGTAFSVGAVAGLVGTVVCVVAGLPVVADVVVIASSWAAGTSAGWWVGSRRG